MEAADQGLPNLLIPLPSLQEVAALSISSFGYQLPAHQLPLYHQFACSFLESCHGLTKQHLDLSADNISSPLTLTSDCTSAEEQADCESSSFNVNYPTRSHTPMSAACEENPLGAWTVRCCLFGPLKAAASPADSMSAKLFGKRVVIKDNIPIAGMPMYCGTSLCFTPLADSPLVSRCLAAGASIVGKSQCEYMCFSGASHTASAGAVRNPNAPEYHAGGSSSGSGVLVANGEADLAIGCDQGGSCRIPGAMCGVVGCKPTHGLVPYTLIDGMYGPIDHAGPITRTVEDNALMLGVLAGWDGVDERASTRAKSMNKVDYCEGLKEGIKGLKIGLVEEGLMAPFMEEDVRKATEDLAGVLREMGAEVATISVPLHVTANGIWLLSVLPNLVTRLFYSSERDPLLGVDDHGKVYDRLTFMRHHLLAHVASWSFQFRLAVLVGEWLRLRCPESSKVADAYKQELVRGYALAFSHFDVLVMPTTACKSKKLPKHLSTADDYEHASAELLAEHVDLGLGLTVNTLCFNLTGHPALSLPIAASRIDDGRAVLPIGMMLAANHFEEALLYRVAYALEQARPWQSALY